ncbi:hypothetical protein [Rufibacter soli]
MNSFQTQAANSVVEAAKGHRLLEAVRLMRAAQKTYFQYRTNENLKAAKIHEAQVDRLIEPEPAPTNQIPLF